MNIDSKLKTLTSYLDYQAKNNPDKIAYKFLKNGQEVGNLSFQQLREESLKIAAKLQSYQTKNNKFQARALLLYPPSLEFITAFMGCLYAGIIAVPAYPPANERIINRLKVMINDCTPDFILTTKEIESGINKIKSLQKFYFIGGNILIPKKFKELRFDNKSILIATNSENISQINPDQYQATKITQDDIAFLQYTSGSTSDPKGVVICHKNLVHNINLFSKHYELTPDEIMVSWLPIYHDMGLIGAVLATMVVGCELLFMSPLDFLKNPYLWLKIISDNKATYSGGPNFAYDLCLKKITDGQIKNLDLSSWRIAVSGAEPIRKSTLQNFAQKFASCGFKEEFLEPAYGMAETTLFVAAENVGEKPKILKFNRKLLEEKNQAVLSDDNDLHPQNLISHGQVNSMESLIIANKENARKCQEGEVGEIWIQDKSVADEYWNRPEKTKETFQNYVGKEGPYLATGDLGFIFANQLFIAGRLKDLIIIRGKNFYPQDLEKISERSHKYNRKGCVVAFGCEFDGEEKLIIVQEVKNAKKNDYNLCQKIIDDITKDILEEYEVLPYDVVLLQAHKLSKTTSGKVQRAKVKQEYQQQKLAGIINSKLNLLRHSNVQSSWFGVTNIFGLISSKNQQPKTAIEKDLARIWIDVLNLDQEKQINRDDNFFALGGDSLAVMTLATALSSKYDFQINYIYEYPTIKSLAKHLHKNKANFEKRFRILKDVLASDYQNKLPDKSNLIPSTIPPKQENILLTGVTGFVGIHLLDKILNDSTSKVYLIARGYQNLSAKDRLIKIYDYYFGKNLTKYFDDRIAIIDGNLTKKNLGLKASDYHDLADKIDNIINSAANINWVCSLEDSQQINHQLVLELIKLQKIGQKNGRKITLNHISTLGLSSIFFCKQKNGIFDESVILTKKDQSFTSNPYLITKLAAEYDIIKQSSDYNILRLGKNITINSGTGKFLPDPQRNYFFNLMKAVIDIGHFPKSQRKMLEFSFVDQVAEGMMLLMSNDKNQQIYHIANPNMLSIFDLCQAMNNNFPKQIKALEIDNFIANMKQNLASEHSRAYEDIMLAFGVYNNSLVKNTDMPVSCAKTNEILSNQGFGWGIPDLEILQRFLQILAKNQ